MLETWQSACVHQLVGAGEAILSGLELGKTAMHAELPLDAWGAPVEMATNCSQHLHEYCILTDGCD